VVPKKEPSVERPLKDDEKRLLRLYKNLKRLNRKAQALRDPETPKERQDLIAILDKLEMTVCKLDKVCMQLCAKSITVVQIAILKRLAKENKFEE
jgi:hypothetical protein